jgi:predicted  nucleic acid-binding Zn-ribbon protein
MSTPLRATLDQLLALQKIDSESDRLQRKRQQLNAGSNQEQAAKVAFDAAQAASAHLTQLTRSQKDAELEEASVEGKIKDYEQRMSSGRVTNTREISNIEKELAQLGRQRRALDDKLLTLMDEIEGHRTQVAELEQRSRQAEQDLTTHREHYRADMDRITADLDRLKDARSSASCVDDPAMLQRYEALRARPANSGLAIASIDDRHCGACHMQISTQDEEHVNAGDKLVLCENCGRIMA